MAKKNKLGPNLRREKWFLGKKLTNFQKKDFFGQKKQAGAELKKEKKDLLGQKLGKKLSIRDKKLPI